MDEQTLSPTDGLLPVRIKDRRDYIIGDEEKALSNDSGFTREVVYATVDSILKCGKMKHHDVHKVASVLDDNYLDFDSYKEEYDSRFGRPLLEMIIEDGEEAYEALQGEMNLNPYLHAAINDISVWEATRELDTEPNLVVQTDNGWTEFGKKYSNPNAVGVVVRGDDGEFYETDLREVKPDIEWVSEHWKATGGRRKHTRRLTNTDDDVEILGELAVKEVQGEIMDAYIRNRDGSITVHYIREKEESIVDEEDDRWIMACGSTISAEQTVRLSIDNGTVSDRKVCGNCSTHAE